MSSRTPIWVETVLGAVGLLVFVLLAQAFVAGGQVVSFDDNVARWVADTVPSWLEWVSRALSRLGGIVGTVVVAGAAFFVLWRAGRRIDAGFVAASVVGITVLVWVLKSIYERGRPDHGSPIALPHSYSFPSGHAATAVVLYGALGLLLAERARTRVRAVAWLAGAAVLALAIGASRVLLNVHFVSDVLAGFAVGLAWLCCCAVVRDFLAAGGAASASPRSSPS
jgi:undecaprenyl-diphosphatase